MKKIKLLSWALLALASFSPLAATAAEALAPVAQVGVKVDGYWREKFRLLTVKWLPHCIKMMEKGGKGEEMLNLVATAEKLAGKKPSVKFKGCPWSDAYPYNTVEAACLALEIDPESDVEWQKAQAHLRAKINEWIPIFLAAQEPSGYIHSFHDLNGRPHFRRLNDHEFYVMGYFIEMGIAHRRLTGGKDNRLWDAAKKLADHLDATFGPAPKRTWANGHPGLEYALLRLADAVNLYDGAGKGDRYARLAQWFVRHQYCGDADPGNHRSFDLRRAYNQMERPAWEMTEAMGHAVRATYFYTAMCGIGRRLNDAPLATAADKIFDNAINRKMYITGGVGASPNGEAFGGDYDLRQNGYCESCAACGMSFWCMEEHRTHGTPWHEDVRERLLYNNLLGSFSADGENFYYQNPLTQSNRRYPWHGCPCCVGNIPRTLFALKDTLFAVSGDQKTLYVDHFMGIDGAVARVGGATVKLYMTTAYPADGKVKLVLEADRAATFDVKVRFPNRCESALYTTTPEVEHGYRSLASFKGEAGAKTVEFELPMPEQTVRAIDKVEACRNLAAFQRGPIVYAWEGPNGNRKVPVSERLNAPDAGVARVWVTGPVVVDIDLEKKGAACPKTLWGVFFEDINYAADGGIYPELLANRGFDWQTKELEGWERDARGDGMARITRQYGKPVHEATAAHLRIEAFGAGEGVGVKNRGYHGMFVEAGKRYTLSFYARGLGGYKGNLRAVLEAGGKTLCSYTVKNDQLKIGAPREGALFELPDWTRFETVFTPNATARDATFSILLDEAGAVELEQVSLFPEDTFNGRKNGLRKDLVQKLKDLKPGVLRFPGGCVTEGRDWPLWYDWKLSVGEGPLESRSCIWNTWGYWQSMGLGYYEYFCLCEDLGAEPLPVMNGGITCQFARPWDIAPLGEIDYFTKNFCDLIEFANGDPATTKWGALRAKMGHPKPFNLKYLGIGNENWDKVFVDRYEAIAKDLRKRHPEIRLVGPAGAGVDGASFHYAWKRITTEIADVLDEHYYESPAWFLANANRYDAYPRTATRPQVYVGEYACHVPGRANNLYAALCEAALMAGFERNCDIVKMTSYAPLFCKIGGTQWKCDMIWYDNAQSFGTPSYYVQKLFSNNLPTRVVPSKITNGAGGMKPLAGCVALQTWNTAAEFKDIKVTALDGRTLFEGLPDPAKCSRGARGQWTLQNGVLRQSAENQSDTALRFGDAAWRDYTFTFKARRTGGAEAFMAQVMVGNKGAHYLRVNLGGWDNRESAFENFGLKIGNPTRISDSYELNRWYAISVRVKDGIVRVDVDGKKKFETTVEEESAQNFFQSCGYDAATNELVVKLVNVNEVPRTAKLNFGRALPAGKARVQLLTGERSWVNSLEAPTKVAPRETAVDFPGGAEWEVTTPSSSLSVYRIKL